MINKLKVFICMMMFHGYKATIQTYFDDLIMRQMLLFLSLIIMVRQQRKTVEITIWFPEFSSHGEGNGHPLQYSCLENPMDRGAWWAAVHVAKSQTRLSDFTFTFPFHALEKEMATHSSALARRIPGMAEPGGLPSMGSHRVGHNCSDLVAAF